LSAASESLSDARADHNWIRESEKDSLAVRESSAGRVAFTLGNCTGTNATAGEAGTCPNPAVQNACSRPCSNRSSPPFGGSQLARSTSGHDLGVRGGHQEGSGTRGLLAERLRLACARSEDQSINQLDQFTTEIDGQQIYFIYQRSPRPDAIPLMLIHGWPGSILEFEKLIGPLTHPRDVDFRPH
jgi:Epoxide hydrolase N terminus